MPNNKLDNAKEAARQAAAAAGRSVEVATDYAADKLDEVKTATSEKLQKGKEAASSLGRTASVRASRIIGDLRNDASDLAGKVSKTLKSSDAKGLGKEACRSMRKKPLAAAGIAAAIGFVAARLLKPRRRG